MDKLFLPVFALFISSSMLIARQSTPTSKNSIEDGAWALQFQITNNFTLTSFEGTTISIKHFTSSTNALRLGATLGASVSDNDNNSPTSIDSIRATSSNDVNSQSIAVQLHFLVYPSPTSDVNLFLGLGPFGSYFRSRSSVENDHLVDSRDSVLSRSATTGYGWGIGVNALIGAEWFATHGISVSAEYSTSAGYSSSTTTTDFDVPQSSSSERTSKGFNLNSSSVRFGISAYF